MKPRILFVPDMMPSHIIPLIALARLLKKSQFECAFLLPQLYHNYVRSLGFTVLEIDHKRESRSVPQMMAIGMFKPDVIVDDLSYTSAFLTRMAKLPRISIVRKGIIPFESNNSGYEHSCQHIYRVMEEVNEWGGNNSSDMWKPKHYSELFVGDVNIIPSIPSVDVLPEQLKAHSSYVYCGPLLLNDQEIMESETHLFPGKNNRSLQDFFTAHKHRKKVYITTGLTIVPEIHERLAICIRFLLEKGVAIITNEINPPGLRNEERSRLYTSRLLPMHEICGNVDLMIHHCGSGTYNYQLIHKVPAIILGSRLYDRDEIAVRLNELEAACYFSADLENETFSRRFDQAVSALLNTSSDIFQKQTAALSLLTREISDTQTKFDFPEIINRLLRNN